MDYKKLLAIIFDFDGTLTKTKQPKYLIINECGYDNGTQSRKFLDEVKAIQRETGEQRSVVFKKWLLKLIKDNNLNDNIENFNKGQDSIEYNKGVTTFFDNINYSAKVKNVSLQHYIVTSGFIEYLYNLELAKYFTKIYGSTFKLDKDNNIIDIATNTTYQMKIEAIKDINRANGKKENDCNNTIYVGDSLTDGYAMDFIHNNGGKTIFVHQTNETLDIYNELNKNNIVDFCVEANYDIEGPIFKIIKDIINEI